MLCHTRRKAFSLIELSIVILVIGIIVAGVLVSNALIKKFRITTAQTLTQSSPVNGIPDSVLWLESSLDKSFKSSESDDTSSLSAWYDIRESANKNSATQTNSSNSPTYSNSINYIQAVKFDGTNGYFNVDGSVLNNTNYTIFVLEQRESNKSGNYFIGDSSSANQSTTNKNLVLGYSADGTVIHSQSSDNSYSSSISTYAASSGKPRIFTFVHDKSSGKKTYINGLLAATSTDTNNLSGMTTLTIGKSYQGQIGEVVMFARSLNDEERQSIEDYLGKKWNSTILRSVGGSASSGGIGGSCVGGTVGNSSCLTTCTVTAANGITATTVNGGSGSLSCDTTNNFTGSLAYSCINGVFQYTTTTTSCSCASGYTLISGVCVPTQCAFSGVTGITNGTVVNMGSGSQTCNVANYSGSVNYTCNSGGGSPTINSGSCSLAPCTTTGSVTTTSITVAGTGYTVHKFTSGSGTINCAIGRTASVLVVAGGGSGSGVGHGNTSGGGGAGGLVYQSSYSISANVDIPVTVGAGGTNSNGGNSTFGTITAIGGGYSQAYSTTTSGGSGAGGSSTSPTGGTGTAGQGNAGGNFVNYSCSDGVGGYRNTGGGGGAGGAGQDGQATTGGVGGIGLAYSITGTSTYYAGGGGGIGRICSVPTLDSGAAGGLGGGGSAGGTNGTANTGGGGGPSGGSGVVIVRY